MDCQLVSRDHRLYGTVPTVDTPPKRRPMNSNGRLWNSTMSEDVP